MPWRIVLINLAGVMASNPHITPFAVTSSTKYQHKMETIQHFVLHPQNKRLSAPEFLNDLGLTTSPTLALHIT